MLNFIIVAIRHHEKGFESSFVKGIADHSSVRQHALNFLAQSTNSHNCRSRQCAAATINRISIQSERKFGTTILRMTIYRTRLRLSLARSNINHNGWFSANVNFEDNLQFLARGDENTAPIWVQSCHLQILEIIF